VKSNEIKSELNQSKSK